MAENSGLNAANAMLALHDPKPGRALVVGSKIYGICLDRRTLYPNALGLDMQEGAGVDIVHDMEHRLPESVGKFEHVDCCSVLEHVRHPWLMGKAIEDALEADGTLLIAVPFVWRMHAYPSDYWRFTPEALEILFPNIDWIDRKMYSNDQVVLRPPKLNDGTGQKWLGRTELVAFGIKK